VRRVFFALGLFLARFRAAMEPVLPDRFEVQESPGGVGWVLDFQTRRKYPFSDRRRAELALPMLASDHAPVMLSIPFSNVDARKAL
jgi:hypothetical protein